MTKRAKLEPASGTVVVVAAGVRTLPITLDCVPATRPLDT
jgi:hypothetical protein